MDKYNHMSLDQMDKAYRYGSVPCEDLREYLRQWNAGPHFTQAIYRDGAIRNYDPETHMFHRDEVEEFGVRI